MSAFSFNVYDEIFNEDTHLDLSSQELEKVPEIKNLAVVVIYLQDNKLEKLPDDFFPSLSFLMYLDLRDNRLTEIPTTIQDHPTLTHLLLQNNYLKSLPNELGTLNLKVLQLNGNPLSYPPIDIINSGVAKILKFLYDNFLNSIKEDFVANEETKSSESFQNDLKVQVSEKNDQIHSSQNEQNSIEENKTIVKKPSCPKFKKTFQKPMPPFCQSSKYLKALRADDRSTWEAKMRKQIKKDAALAKRKEWLENTDKVLQERKNIQALKSWRGHYRDRQMFRDGYYKLNPETFPYDTNPEYFTLLCRAEIEKDLPDKYKKNILRRPKHSVPRKSNKDKQLALKIKQLFENLQALDLNKREMTPRTEQKVLLNEIHKITEIKQKLKELSTANLTSV